MKLEASAQDVRMLLQLVELDGAGGPLSPDDEARRAEAVRARLPPTLAERYLWVLQLGRRPAVAAIDGGRCMGCHLRLPTMVEWQARQRPSVHVCPHCCRMLYAPEHLEVKAAPSPEPPAAPRRRRTRAAAAKQEVP